MVPAPDPPSAMQPANWAGIPAPPANPDSIPVLQNPNILVIMVDQMRQPQWLDSAHQANYVQNFIPNIYGIQNSANSVWFDQYYVAATACSPSRSCIMTGLYTPQTAMYTTQGGSAELILDPRYQTWGGALTSLNPAYANVYWFGKWHLSAGTSAGGTLTNYGFNTTLYPSNGVPSPDGWPNQGNMGGLFNCPPKIGTGSEWYEETLASDAQIVTSFNKWVTANPSGPWCATVSLINPHDIGKFPYWVTTFPGGCQPANQPGYGSPYFNAPGAIPTPPGLMYTPATQFPTPWNYETQPTTGKPSLQNLQTQSLNAQFNSGSPLTSTQYNQLLNYYYYMQYLVDYQVGQVLGSLSTAQKSNTIIVFTADHGEFGGSHGMRDKAGAVYDEAIRVPLCIQVPGMTGGPIRRDRMCSAVDFFGLICDLGASSPSQVGAWKTQYPDLANRESIYSMMYNDTPETRLVSIRIGGQPATNTPYILHTTDENFAGETGGTDSYAQLAGTNSVNDHVVCIRTKTSNNGMNGFKYAVYSNWSSCTTFPNGNTPDYEYYDYEDGIGNRQEIGNNYPAAAGSNSLETYDDLQTALGAFNTATPYTGGTGIIGTELNVALGGKGTDGTKLNCVLLDTQRPQYFTSLKQTGTGCTPPTCT